MKINKAILSILCATVVGTSFIPATKVNAETKAKTSGVTASVTTSPQNSDALKATAPAYVQ